MKTDLIRPETRSMSMEERRMLALLMDKQRLEGTILAPGVPAQRRRLEGWPLVGLILGTLFCVISMIYAMFQAVIRVAERSADRSHELAMRMTESAPALTGHDLAMYGLLFVLAVGVMVWCLRNIGVVP